MREARQRDLAYCLFGTSDANREARTVSATGIGYQRPDRVYESELSTFGQELTASRTRTALATMRRVAGILAIMNYRR